MKKLIVFFTFLFAAFITMLCATQVDNYVYADSWGNQGYELLRSNESGIELNFSITDFNISQTEIRGYQKINFDKAILPNEAGAPDLPSISRYIAIPQNAVVDFNIIDFRKEVLSNINIIPAFRIPLDTDDAPLDYSPDESIYSIDEFYPKSIVQISEVTKIRGVDVVILGISPFQYNPVTKELNIFRDIKIELNFSRGNGHFGEDRLRNKWWDPILKDAILNSASLPQINYNKQTQNRDGAEYLIICPDDATFIAWADSIKNFRQEQGISTMVVTTTEIGGNTTTAIENYVNNAYNNWSTPPVAVLLLGDYGSSGNTVMSSANFTHPYSGTYISDNVFADVDGDDLPEIAFARMTAQNSTHLENMITKFLDYERQPPTNSNFYNNPITALGWQDDRWFQICSETIGGFFNNELGKTSVRINALGTPANNYNSGPWSTATNTTTVLNYFGPNGLGYIPATPQELGGFTGGNATDVNNAINSGAFILQHRDHGGNTGWGEPYYLSSHLSGLGNNDPVFVMSINCLTGRFDYGSEVFAEAFNIIEYGALGVIAASKVSYYFVNDAYVWGLYDYMWPDFDPGYGSSGDINILPCFGNASAKYYLQASGWPSNPSSKTITYRLFHHHGDAFSTVYSEIPQNLAVNHSTTLLTGVTSFPVTTDNGSFIALTVNGEIIATADGTGFPVSISIPAQNGDNDMLVTITKQNYFRYSSIVDVIPLIPDITVNPLSYSETLGLNATQDRTLSITNDGESGSTLNYDILISETSGREIAKSNNYSDYNCTDQLESVPAKYKTIPNNTDATTLSYHNGYVTGVGTNGIASWICAARFTSTELSPYYTTNEITQVRIFMYSSYFSNCTIKVWEGGSLGNPGNEVYSQDITGSVSVGSFTTHILSSPVTLISGNEYWIGYSLDATGDHPSGADSGPIIAEKGGWMYLNNSWSELDDLGINRNWCIEMVIDENTPVFTITSPNGSEVWANGEPHNITWNHSGAALANVKLELSTNNGTGYSDIIASTPNDGTYGWTVSGTTSEECLVRVSDPAVPTTNDVSNAVFRIYDTVTWLSIDQDNGSLGQSFSDNLTLTFDSSGLSAGTYNANIEITSNDPDEATVIIPVTLTVNDNSSSGSGNNGGGSGSADVDMPLTNIDGNSVNPDVSIDPNPNAGITVNVTVTDEVQGSVPVAYPENVIISYAVDVIGTIDGVNLAFDIEFTGLTGLDQIHWLNGTIWQVPNNVSWSTPDHVTFNLTLTDRNASTEIILSSDGPLPVSLSSFTAIYSNGSPTINWVTQSESDNIGWNIYRANSSNLGQAFILNLETIPGNGTTSQPSFYSFTDEYDVQENSTYWYWLESISSAGETEMFGPVSLTIPSEGNNIPEIPLVTELRQNFPNPFNPCTLISFDIKENETGVLSIYNIKGQLIVTKEFETGRHNYTWDAREQSSGVYLYKLQTENFTEIKKMLLLK